MLSLTKDQIGSILKTVDELDARATASELYADANLSDDTSRSVLDDLPGDDVFHRRPQDRVHDRLLRELNALPRAAQVELVLLLRVGQGHIAPADLCAARDKARNLNQHQIVHLLVFTPMLGVHLRKALFATTHS